MFNTRNTIDEWLALILGGTHIIIKAENLYLSRHCLWSENGTIDNTTQTVHNPDNHRINRSQDPEKKNRGLEELNDLSWRDHRNDFPHNRYVCNFSYQFLVVSLFTGSYSMVPNGCDHLQATYYTSPYLTAHAQPFLCGSLLHPSCDACYGRTPYSYGSISGTISHFSRATNK